MIQVGICGFARAQRTVFTTLRVLEVQQTFYRPPNRAMAEAWRVRAPPEFEFTVKAWQLITHEPGSPTYRKGGIAIAEHDHDRYGSFRPSGMGKDQGDSRRIGREANRLSDTSTLHRDPRTSEQSACLFQGVEHRDSSDLTFVWEQRGNWNRRTIASVCAELGLIHVVDPFAEDSVTAESGFAYFRLHGKPPGKRMYRYTYTDDDLRALHAKCEGLKQVYVLFNNETMYEDAVRFMRLIEEQDYSRASPK